MKPYQSKKQNQNNMKTNRIFLSFLALMVWQMQVFAQTTRPKIAVIGIDIEGSEYNSELLNNSLRRELEKTNLYEVMDKYDINYLAKKDSLSLKDCYGKICLVEIGKAVKADKMLTGSVEQYHGKNMIITLRLIDVNAGIIEKTQINEFLDLPKETPTMLAITLRNMFGLENDSLLLTRLTKKDNLDTEINNPYQKRLRLDGPRMGVTYFQGEKGDIIRAAKSEGGFDALPVFFQFGYQFETQYLNEGNFQALFEFIPLISGVDQGYFIPSFTILNGLRNNRSGWEFAFGPSIRFINQAEGYYVDNKWVRKTADTPADQTTITRLDSRGDLALNTGFVLALGKTFRSGKLNIPMNIYAIPYKGGVQYGFSFGFNAKND
jgi:TolB-like protein